MNSLKRDEMEERNSYRPLEYVLKDKEIAFLGPDVIAEHLSKRKGSDGSCLVSRKICSIKVSRKKGDLEKNLYFFVFKYLQTSDVGIILVVKKQIPSFVGKPQLFG